ncbi:hypothetical protein ACSSVZ_002729 [Amorphus sp. MBR-141]
MRRIGLSPIYQAPKTNEPHPQHRSYPYLLRQRHGEIAIDAVREVGPAAPRGVGEHRLSLTGRAVEAHIGRDDPSVVLDQAFAASGEIDDGQSQRPLPPPGHRGGEPGAVIAAAMASSAASGGGLQLIGGTEAFSARVAKKAGRIGVPPQSVRFSGGRTETSLLSGRA